MAEKADQGQENDRKKADLFLTLIKHNHE